MLLSLVLAVFSPFVVGAGDAPLDRGTLRGLKSLSVIVDPIDPQLDRAGLTAAVLRNQLEARLRHGGVTVDEAAVEFLGLHVSSTQIRKGPYSLCLSIGLYQPVVQSRDKEIRTATQTWEVDTILLAQPKGLMQSSTAALDQLADRFVNAWRSVNP
jgi:hypothetical protein